MISFDDDVVPRNAKKKGKANGFLMFMLDYKRNQERSGTFMEMNEAQEKAGEIWKSMGAKDREKYDNSSTKSNQREPMKYTTTGVSFDEIDRQKAEKIKQQKMMELTIEEMLQTAEEQRRLKNLTFYFFSTSYFVQTLNGDIFPAEIAMSKFSLMDGVHDSFNFLVNPGALPLGMASEAKIHSEKTHRFPTPPNIEGEESYEIMFNQIMEYVVGADGQRKLPPIFVEPGLKGEDFKAAVLTLEKIVKEGGRGQNIVFRVFPMEHLLYRLHKKCIEARNNESDTFSTPFRSVLVAKDIMSRDDFMHSDIGCHFHRVKDANHHCCLSKVKRWGYMISRLCLDNETDTMICGRHLPEKSSVLSEDDVLSTIVKDSEWASNLTNSFKTIRIDSKTTISHSSMPSYPRSSSRLSESTDSIHSIEETQEIAPSTTDATESLRGYNAKGPMSVKSYSELLRNSGRGGKR